MLFTEIVINTKRENDQNDKTDLQDRPFRGCSSLSGMQLTTIVP